MQQGYSLLALTVLLMLLGFAGAQVTESTALQQRLLLQQHGRQTQILEHIRASLLGFAANQGLHSQSHLGHLPCPAMQAGGYPQTSCLNKPWGHLPVSSKTAVNYLNPGIDARINELEPSARKQWHYAVSAQLVQPNALGWGRWVDYSQPAIRIQIPAENNRIEQDIAAVVASHIKAVADHQYSITPPYTLIKTAALRKHMGRAQARQLNDTLQAWQQLNPELALPPGHYENIVALPSQQHMFQPVDSGCYCRCTKTRCSCSCNGSGSWQSGPTTCTSTANEPCVFGGAASMQSWWPVSRFEPVAAVNKSCRPTARNQCPLSRDNNPCTCSFSWPDNISNDLHRFSFSLPNTP